MSVASEDENIIDATNLTTHDEKADIAKQLDLCINNLFEVPSRNIGSAFELILGLIKDQSSEINNLKRAQLESFQKYEEIRIQQENAHQTAIEEWGRGRNEIVSTFQNLKKEHEDLKESHEISINTVLGLKDEIKVRNNVR